MNKYKFGIKRFSELFKFSKISKDVISLQRLDKISIFEYFELIEERNIAKPYEFLIKEIADYIYSPVFSNEFKLALINDEKKFKFFLMNISLVAHRVKQTLNEDNINLFTHLKRLVYGNDNQNYLDRIKIIYYVQFLPLKFFSKENLQFYISKNQISKYYENNHIIEEEFIKKYTKIEFSFLKLKRQFINDLDKIEDDEEEFKKKYINNFLLKNNDNKFNENEADKLLLYFIAHVKYC